MKLPRDATDAHRSRLCKDYVGFQINQLFRGHLHPANIAGGATNVHAHVAANCSTQLRKHLREPGEVCVCLKIVFVARYQHAGPLHLRRRLLRPHCQRPRRYRWSRVGDSAQS
jgi:hypothetical protein